MWSRMGPVESGWVFPSSSAGSQEVVVAVVASTVSSRRARPGRVVASLSSSAKRTRPELLRARDLYTRSTHRHPARPHPAPRLSLRAPSSRSPCPAPSPLLIQPRLSSLAHHHQGHAVRSTSPAMPRQRPAKATTASSPVTRIAKFSLSLYLLAAILYTACTLVLAPSVSFLSGGRILAPRSQVVLGGTAPDLANLVVAPADDQSLAGSAADASATGPSSASTRTTKLKHAALETAGVRAADIRQEDSSDPVWAAAEVAERKGKKSKSTYRRPDVVTDSADLVHKRMHGFDGVDWDKDQMVWHPPASDLAHSGPQADEAALAAYGSTPGEHRTLSEDEFLSLSFGSSLQPSKVIPYYYRASDPDRVDFNKDDITITTLVTSNRFTVFERLVERYRGASSSPPLFVVVSDLQS